MFLSLPLVTIALGIAVYKVCSDSKPINIVIELQENERVSMKVTGPLLYNVEGLTPAEVADNILHILNTRDYTSIMYECPREIKDQIVYELQRQTEALEDEVKQMNLDSSETRVKKDVLATSYVLKMWRTAVNT